MADKDKTPKDDKRKKVNLEDGVSLSDLKGIEDEGYYGWFSFEPRFLQFVNTPGGYMVAFGVYLTLQSLLVNGYTNVIITTLEQRFRLQSYQTGLIVVSYDIGYFLLCLFVTFYGNRAHRPRMLTIGSLVFGFGCLIFAIPHFTTGRYTFQGNYSDICDPDFEHTCDTDDNAEDVDQYFYLFLFAMLLQGFGCIPLYTVGFAVIEDSVPKGKSAVFIGIANALTILGPTVGYMVGGLVLSIYVDFEVLQPGEDPGIDPSSPGWVGAWWVGYLVVTAALWIIVSIPMSGFPKQLPGSALVRSQKESEVHAGAAEEITNKEDFGTSIKDMPPAIYAMVKNTAFLFTTLAGCSEGFIISAFTAFLPKFIESQFNLTAGTAALYAGIVAIPGGVFGTVLSGVIIQQMRLKTPAILKMCITCCAVVLVMVPAVLIRCPTAKIAGVNTPYDDIGNDDFEGGNLTDACNQNCGCQAEYFTPVCGDNNITYFSSCFAGCFDNATDPEVYRKCSCVGQATSGFCEEPCEWLAPFLGLFFVIVMVNFMTTTPALLVVMRCVPENQKSFAIGVQWWIVRALGSIPGPVVFGVIFDATCILWQESFCSDELGSCWLNDTQQVAVYLTIASGVCKAISVILFSTALYVYRPVTKALNDDGSSNYSFCDSLDDSGKGDSSYENSKEMTTAL